MNVFEKISEFVYKHLNTFLYGCLTLSAIISFCMFDIKVSDNGDDSWFIIAAQNFLNSPSYYPGLHGPIYPFYLALIMAVFGFSVGTFKVFTLALLFVHHYFFFKTFSKHFKNSIFYITFLLLCTNLSLISHAILTMSETLFIALLSVVFYYFDRHFINPIHPTSPTTSKSYWKKMFVLSFLLFVLYHARYIGIVGFGVVGLHFLWEVFEKKSYRSLFMFSGSSVVLFALISALKWFCFGVNVFARSGQFKGLMLKDYYKPAFGQETLTGFLERFWENSNFYLRTSFPNFLGLEKISSEVFTYIFYAVFIVLLLRAFTGKRKLLLYIGLFSTGCMVLTFFILQSKWLQSRLVLINFPFILLFFAVGLADFFKKKPAVSGFMMCFVLTGLFSISAKNTWDGIRENHINLKESLKGNNLYGMTTDRKNYALACKYAGRTVPDSIGIWCRKPSIANIYGKRKFSGIYRVPSVPFDEAFPQKKEARIILKYMDVIKYPNINNPLLPYIYTVMYGNRKDGNHEGYPLYLSYQVFSKGDHDYITEYLKKYAVPFETDVDDFSEGFSTLIITNPDEMLKYLGNHRYLIKASLRLYPSQKTAYTINTVERFLISVSTKYPNLLTEIKTFGKEETATLYKINYPPKFGK